MSDTPPRRRWLRLLCELFLALAAVVCAVGWVHEYRNRPQDMTVKQAMHLVSDTEPQYCVECRLEGPEDFQEATRYWIVRERPAAHQPAPASE